MPASPNEADGLPRVLLALNLDPALKFGTLEEQVLALARAFSAREGMLLPLYSGPLAGDAASQYARAGLRAEGLDLTRFRPGTLARLLRVLRHERIDVVHWHFYDPVANPYLAALTVLAPRVRHVYTDHISRPRGTLAQPAAGWRAAVKRLLLRRYDAVYCVSEYVREQLQAQGVWPRLRRVTHFVNTDRFRPDPEVRARVRAELSEAPGRFVAVTVAYLIPEKGIETAVRAVATLGPDAALWVIGAGPEAPRLSVLAADLGAGDRVRFLGLQSHVEPYLQAADVFVCPSVWEEAAGLVNIEALATGLPVLASGVGGIPEIIDGGRTGYLLPPGDPVALADRLRRLRDDPDARAAFGVQARNDALERFSADALVPEYLDLYRELVPARDLSARGPRA